MQGAASSVLQLQPTSQGAQGPGFATSTATLHRPITSYMIPIHPATREESVTAADDGQEPGPSGIARPQSGLSTSSAPAAAASDDEDDAWVCILCQPLSYT